MVSAADTRKMMQAEMIAPVWNSGIKGSRWGKEMIPPDIIRLKSTFPRKMAMTYPTIRPASTDSCFKYPLAKMFHKRQVSRVTVPRIRFWAEPKSSAYPPPKDLAPTVKRENPMAVTTEAATTGVMILRQYLARSPRVPSKIPPMSTAPTTAG